VWRRAVDFLAEEVNGFDPAVENYQDTLAPCGAYFYSCGALGRFEGMPW
jgi:hypothetical protein